MSLRATTGKQDVSLPHAETSEEMLGSNRILLAVVGPVCCGPGVGGGARWGITQLAPLVPLCASVPDLERGGHLEVPSGGPLCLEGLDNAGGGDGDARSAHWWRPRNAEGIPLPLPRPQWEMNE